MQAQRQQQQHAHGSERSLQDTAAFLEGLFAASYAAQPLEDVGQCYEVNLGGPGVCGWQSGVLVFHVAAFAAQLHCTFHDNTSALSTALFI
jgi:hypothetical protein